jgi:hypothetical protein
VAEGIVKRHSAGCPSRDGGACRCNAGYEAWVYLPQEKKKVRKTFARRAEAKSWRAEALAAVGRRTMHSPSSTTVEQAAWLWLEGALSGAVRDRSGRTYKPGTLREYQRSLAHRVLPAFGGIRLSELSRAEVQAFVDTLLAERLSPSTVGNTLNPLQAIYRHAVRRDLVAVNPTRDVELPTNRGRRIGSPLPPKPNASSQRCQLLTVRSGRPPSTQGSGAASCRPSEGVMSISLHPRSRSSGRGTNTRDRFR